MNSYCRYSYLWFAFLATFSCIGYSYGQLDIVFKTPEKLQLRVLDSIITRHFYRKKTDSLLLVINQAKAIAKERDDFRFQAYYEVFKASFEIHTKGFDLKKDNLHFHKLISIAKARKDTLFLIMIAKRMGDVVRDVSFAKSTPYYLIVLENAPHIDHGILDIDIGRIELDVAAYYYHMEEYDKAVEILSKCQHVNTIDYKGMGCYDLWSQICLKQKDYKGSREKIRRAFNIYRQSDTTSWFFNGWDGIFIGNLGKVDYYEKEYDKAIPLLKEGIRITEEALMFDNVGSFGLLLAKSYIYTNQASRAVALLPMIKNALYKNINMEPQFFVDYYKLCLALSPGIHHVKSNLDYFDSLEFYNERLLTRKNKDLKIKEELELELTTQAYFQKQLEIKISRQQQIRNISIGLVMFIFAIIIRAIYKKQKELLNQKKLTQEIRNKAHIELTEAKKELDSFKEFLLEKNRQINNLESSLLTKDSHQDLESLKLSVILTDSDWLRFKSIFGNVYPDFIENLKTNFPLLTQSEIRYFLLLKMGLSHSEMASILGVSSGAMRTMKSRIYKKLDLNEETNLLDLSKPH